MDARIFDHAFNDFGGRVDHLLRIIAAFGLALGLASGAQAGSVALTLPANVTQTATGFATKAAAAFSGTSNVAFNSGLTTQVAGKAVTVPASWRLAANAGQFAGAAIRLNPAGLIGGAVAAWLLTQGIQYVNGQLTKGQNNPNACFADCYTWVAYAMNGVWRVGNSPQEALDAVVAYASPLYPGWTFSLDQWQGNYQICNKAPGAQYCSSYTNIVKNSPRPPDTAQQQPVTDADVAALPQLSPEAATELAAKGQPLPLQNPQVDTAPQQVPLSEPRIDPVTGKKVRDIANVNPASDGKTANIEIAKQELDPATNQPKTDANGNPEPQIEVKDMCEKNPDAAGCKPLDDVEDQNVENRDISLSIIPLPGFGPGTASCPAPVSLGTKGGQAIQWEWTKFCDFSLGIRPLVLAFAWIAAAMIVVGVARKQGA